MFKPGDTVRVKGESKIETVESIGPDGWVYTTAGAANTPDKFEHAEHAPVASAWCEFNLTPSYAENVARWNKKDSE